MKIKSIRIDSTTGKITEPEQVVGIRKGFFYLDPGVTGYESISAKNILERKLVGWSACAGTPGSWDRLYIPEAELEKLRLVASLMVAMEEGKALP